ncbi:MAG: thioredoxin family protein [Flavobacteriales bacterium]
MRQTILITLLLTAMIACKDKKSTTQETTTQEAETKPSTMKGDDKKPLEYLSEVTWFSLPEVLEMQKATPKPIMIDVYTEWCGPCKALSKNTFGDVRVAKYLNENFYCVKFDAECGDTLKYGGNTYTNPEFKAGVAGRKPAHQFTRFLGVSGYPTLYFMDKDAKSIGPVVGYKTPAQIEIFLHYFAEEKHKTILTPEQWAEYEKGFVVTWN